MLQLVMYTIVYVLGQDWLSVWCWISETHPILARLVSLIRTLFFHLSDVFLLLLVGNMRERNVGDVKDAPSLVDVRARLPGTLMQPTWSGV